MELFGSVTNFILNLYLDLIYLYVRKNGNEMRMKMKEWIDEKGESAFVGGLQERNRSESLH